MIRVSICYYHPENPAAFDDYYSSTHTPLVKQLSGLVNFTAGKCHSVDPAQTPQFYFAAQLTFANLGDFQNAAQSSEMQAAVDDLANFASGGVSIFWTDDDASN